MRRALLSGWRWLTFPPETLSIERRRSFEVMAEIYLLAICLQVAVAPVLYLSGHMLLGHLNLICVAGYGVAFLLHRRLLAGLALTVKLVAMIVFVAYAASSTDSPASLIYCLLFAELELMLADLRRRTKVVASAGLATLALTWVHVLTPTLLPGSLVDTLLADLGLVLIFAMLCIAMLRTLSITDRHERRYRRDATHDSLTAILNRRAIFERASSLWRTGRRFSVVLVDADHFKEINDGFGHSAGDAVLRHLAAQLESTLHAGDLIGRVGGEEFLVLMPEVGRYEALATVSRMRDRLAASPCHFDGEVLGVTLSMGIAESHEGERLRDVIELADRRLYAAKSAGRDRVVSDGCVTSAASRNADRLARGVESALKAQEADESVP